MYLNIPFMQLVISRYQRLYKEEWLVLKSNLTTNYNIYILPLHVVIIIYDHFYLYDSQILQHTDTHKKYIIPSPLHALPHSSTH